MANKSYFSSIPNNSQLGDCEDGSCASNCNEQVSGNDCVPAHNHDNLYYRKQEINEMFESLGIDPEEGGFIPAILEEDVTSTVTEGNINAGDTLLQGTSFTEFVKTFLVKEFDPTFVSPSLALNLTTNLAEVGLTINFNATASFNQGQIRGLLIGGAWQPNAIQGPRAGAAIGYTIDGIASAATRTVSRTITLGQNVIPATVTYGMGPQPISSTGEDFGSPLSAGMLSTTAIINGQYRSFYGPTVSVPTNGNAVRALPDSDFSQTTQFTLDSGTQQIYFVIAVPPGRSLMSVIDLDASNQIITSDYVLVNSNFPGIDGGGNPLSYKLYVKTNGTPYTTNHRHLINLI